MAINHFICIDATAASLHRAMATSNNPTILAPNATTARWLQETMEHKNTLTHSQILSAPTPAAHTMMLATILTLQEESPLLLGQAERYNNIIQAFYCDNAKIWPPASITGCSPHHLQMIKAHIRHTIKMNIIPAPASMWNSINNLGSNDLDFETIISIHPACPTMLQKGLLDKLGQLAKNTAVFTSPQKDVCPAPMHIMPNPLTELLQVNQLSQQNSNAAIASIDERFQQLHQAYHKSQSATFKLLCRLCDCITAPNPCALRELFPHDSLSDEMISALLTGAPSQAYLLPKAAADLLHLIVMVKNGEPFLDIIKAHLHLCKKMGGKIDYMFEGINNSTIVPDYKTAALALFSTQKASHTFLSLSEACETPAETFIIQGLNQGNWPSAEATKLLHTLMTRGKVILTRAETSGPNCEEANFLTEFAIERIKPLTQPINRMARPRPNPKPPLITRPATLSVSAIELLIRDPYAYYARYILGLRRQEKESILAKDFGIMVHNIMAQLQLIDLSSVFSEFETAYTATCEQAIANAKFSSTERLVVLRRMKNLTPYIYELLHQWKKDSIRIMVELDGYKNIALANGTTVKLKARSDRVDHMNDGSVRIIDYKTGASPYQTEVDKGLYPQLPLEAIINSDEPATLFYIETSGKINRFTVKKVKYDMDIVASSLIKLMEMFLMDENDGYFATMDADPKTHEYQHLSRAAEWKY